nr:hypothetical protein Iba_chr13aCG5350 [Ipomoea batatas]
MSHNNATCYTLLVGWVHIFHHVGDFWQPVLHVFCLTWKLIMVFMALFIVAPWGLQHRQPDIQFQHTWFCMNCRFILFMSQCSAQCSHQE